MADTMAGAGADTSVRRRWRGTVVDTSVRGRWLGTMSDTDVEGRWRRARAGISKV
jgi:hypothetical protein